MAVLRLRIRDQDLAAHSEVNHHSGTVVECPPQIFSTSIDRHDLTAGESIDEVLRARQMAFERTRIFNNNLVKRTSQQMCV